MSRFKLVFSESLRSLGANISTTIAATMTVLIGMFLLGLFVALGTWVVSWSEHVKNQLEVKAFFLDEAGVKQINAVRVYLDRDPRVKQYEFVTKKEALADMKKRYPKLVANLPSNPLPASYEIMPVHAEQVKAIAADLRAQKFAGIERVKDGQQTSQRILQVARVIEVVFLVAVVVLLIASTLLIANTIRLSIFSRRREIEVMKLVGATNWFVRGPFMLEGLLCGAAGSLAAIVLLLLGKELALPAILGHIETTSDVRALAFSMTALILLLVGLAVGALGSGRTWRRSLCGGERAGGSPAPTSLVGATLWVALFQGVAAGEHRVRALEEGLERRHVPAQRVRQADDHVEERCDVDRIDERLLRHARGQYATCIVARQVVGAQRHRLDEAERRADTLVDRRRAPVGLDRPPHVLAERVRRDRGVGVCSEGTLVERGDECCEELALTRRPVGGPAHREVERGRERPPEDLGPVVQRLQHAQRARHLDGVDAGESHGSVRRAASLRSRPAATAAATVSSKIRSSS
jgi:cell division transport system permease protein